MANAPAPPPHTPCNFVLAGKAGLMSAACKAALAKCGYNPDDFGSYKDVKSKIDAANNAKAWQDYDAGKGPKPDGPRPESMDTRLAGYQSGHLSQNAAHQSGRGDVCSNPPSCRHTYVPPDRRGPTVVNGNGETVPNGLHPISTVPGEGFRSNIVSPGCNGTPGYISEQAPCMPHQGSARNPTTGHGFVTALECDAASSNGKGPGGDYPRSRESRDADQRTNDLMSKHGNGMAPPTQPTSAGTPTGAAAKGTAVGGTGTAATAASAKGGAPTSPAAVAPTQADVDKAAQCINAFRKAALKKMEKHCKENEAQFTANAGTAAQRADALGKRDRAYKKMRQAENETPPDPERVRRARGEYDRAAERHNQMQRSACMAEQSRALQGGNLPPCREPSTGFDPRSRQGKPAQRKGDND